MPHGELFASHSNTLVEKRRLSAEIQTGVVPQVDICDRHDSACITFAEGDHRVPIFIHGSRLAGWRDLEDPASSDELD